MDEGLSQAPENPTHADTDSGTENDSGLVKVVTVQVNLLTCNRAEWFVPKEVPRRDVLSSPPSTILNSAEEEEVPEVQVELYREEEEEEEDEDLVPEPYPAKRKAEKATAQSKKRALIKAYKEAEVSHNCD